MSEALPPADFVVATRRHMVGLACSCLVKLTYLEWPGMKACSPRCLALMEALFSRWVLKELSSLKVLDPMRRARNLALALSRGRLGSEL